MHSMPAILGFQALPTSATCSTCGYDLAGLSPDGRCPECGASIADSLRGFYLRFRSARYLRTVRAGLIVIQWACGVGLAALIPALAVSSRAGPGRLEAVHALRLATIGALAWGWWLVTTPDPGLPARTDAAASRRVVRRLIWVVLAMEVVRVSAGLSGGVGAAGWGAGRWGNAIWMGWFLVRTVIWLLVLVASMDYLRWLAARLPWNPGRTVFAAWQIGVVLLMVLGRLTCATDALALAPYLAGAAVLCVKVGPPLRGAERDARSPAPEARTPPVAPL